MKKTLGRFFKLIVLLSILLAVFFLKDKFKASIGKKNSYLLFSKFSSQDIAQIAIQDNDLENRIYKKNNYWFLTKETVEYKADEESVNKIVDSILALKKEEIASNNKNKHKELGIDKQKVTFKIKDKVYSLFIGKTYGLNKNYLRLNNENEVFTGEGFSDIFYQKDLRDLRIFFITNENAVSQINLDFNNKLITLDKRNSDWFIGERKAKKERIDFFLDDLKTLKASDIIKQNVLENSFFNNSLNITVKENNEEKKAEFFVKDKDKYYLKISNSSDIFEVASGYVESLKKEEKDFTD